MHINPPRRTKTTHMYNLNQHVLETVSDNPYLGLQISDDLKWSKHITKSVGKASVALGILRRNLKFLPKSCKQTAYVALVRSVLEYGCIVWDPYLQKDINRIEQLQRKAARFIIQDYKSQSPGFMTNILHELGLPPLEKRRVFNRLNFFYKTVQGLVPAVNPDHFVKSVDNKRRIKSKQFSDYHAKNIVDKNVRNNNKCYVVKNVKSDQYKNSYFIRTVSDWNALPDKIVCSKNLDIFKETLKKSMLD